MFSIKLKEKEIKFTFCNLQIRIAKQELPIRISNRCQLPIHPLNVQKRLKKVSLNKLEWSKDLLDKLAALLASKTAQQLLCPL